MAEPVYGLNAAQLRALRATREGVAELADRRRLDAEQSLPESAFEPRVQAAVRITSGTLTDGRYPGVALVRLGGPGGEGWAPTPADCWIESDRQLSTAETYCATLVGETDAGTPIYWAFPPDGFFADLTEWSGGRGYSFQPLKLNASGQFVNADWPPPGTCGGSAWLIPLGNAVTSGQGSQGPTIPVNRPFKWAFGMTGSSGSVGIHVCRNEGGSLATINFGDDVAAKLNAAAPSGVTFANTANGVESSSYLPTADIGIVGFPNSTTQFPNSPNNMTHPRPRLELSGLPSAPAANGPAYNLADPPSQNWDWSANSGDPTVELRSVVWMRLGYHKAPEVAVDKTATGNGTSTHTVVEVWHRFAQAGKVRFAVDDRRTTELDWDASAAEVDAAVDAISAVSVTALSSGDWTGWEITFSDFADHTVAFDTSRLLGDRWYYFELAPTQKRSDSHYVRHLVQGSWDTQVSQFGGGPVDEDGWFTDPLAAGTLPPANNGVAGSFCQQDLFTYVAEFDAMLFATTQTADVALAGGGSQQITFVTGVTLSKRRKIGVAGVNTGVARLDVIR